MTAVVSSYSPRRWVAILVLSGCIGCNDRGSGAAAPMTHPSTAASRPANTAGTQVARSDESSPEHVAHLAAAHYQRRDLDAAVSVLRDGIEKFPGDAQLKFMLGNAYFRQQNWTEAIRWYTAAQRQRPYHPDTPLCLGHAYYMDGNLDLAVRAWREAVHQTPRGELARLALALGLFARGELAEARPIMLEMMSSDPQWQRRTAIDVRWTPQMRADLQRLALAATGSDPGSRPASRPGPG